MINFDLVRQVVKVDCDGALLKKFNAFHSDLKEFLHSYSLLRRFLTLGVFRAAEIIFLLVLFFEAVYVIFLRGFIHLAYDDLLEAHRLTLLKCQLVRLFH